MINQTSYLLTDEQFQKALDAMPLVDFKLALNAPTGNFFYDPWKIKPEFQNTIWEDILSTLPDLQGEARLIRLAPGTNYWAHADIDDRWHVSLINEHSFLVDLTNQQLHETALGTWYTMDAGRLHSAVNFGETDRVQLVVRQLLTPGQFDNPISITIPMPDIHNARYLFDLVYSPWLNRENKNGNISDFAYTNNEVTFKVNPTVVASLGELPAKDFIVIRHW